MVLLVLIFGGYLLSLFWAATGIVKGERLANFFGICFSLFGLGIYAFGFVLSNGKGKEKKGQFDHELSKIEIRQRAAVDQLIHQTNTNPENVKLVAYWEMTGNPGDFVLCVQKGNVIAMQVKNKPLNDISQVTQLTELSWLALNNCDLKTIAKLKLPNLDHLSLANNKLASLDGLQNSPNISWLNFKENPVVDSMALGQLKNKYLFIER